MISVKLADTLVQRRVEAINDVCKSFGAKTIRFQDVKENKDAYKRLLYVQAMKGSELG